MRHRLSPPSYAAALSALVIVLVVPATVGANRTDYTLRRNVRQASVDQLLGQYTHAMARDPENLDIVAKYGAGLIKAGCPQDGIDAFELALGSTWALEDGQAYYLSALREVGRVEESISHRWDMLVDKNLTEPSEIGILNNLLLDYIAAEDTTSGLDVIPMLEAVAAGRATTHGLMAAYAHLRGDDDETQWQIFLSERQGVQHYFTLRLQMEQAIDEGNLEEAWELSNLCRAQRSTDFTVWAAKAEIRRLQGLPEEGLRFAQFKRFRIQEHPAMLGAEARCLADLGQVSDAEAVLMRLATVYPDHPEAIRTKPVVDEARTRGEGTPR